MDGRISAKPASAAAKPAHNFTTNGGARARPGLIFFDQLAQLCDRVWTSFG
jgi:hypothetical protein